MLTENLFSFTVSKLLFYNMDHKMTAKMNRIMNPIKKNSGQSDENSKISYKLLTIGTDDKELLVVDTSNKKVLTEVYIILELPSGEIVSGPYTNSTLAERDFLKISCDGNQR